MCGLYWHSSRRGGGVNMHIYVFFFPTLASSNIRTNTTTCRLQLRALQRSIRNKQHTAHFSHSTAMQCA